MPDVVRMKPIQFFVPFDAVERAAAAKGLDESWVPGYAFVNEVVRGEGGRALKRSAMEAASKTWYEKWGNVREMHGASAAGVVRHSDWDDTGWFVAAEIVDPVAKLKCERGVYKGYSVKVQPLQAQGLDIIECEMIELSLVDRPKDPDALFSLYRSEKYDPGLAYDVELVPTVVGRRDDSIPLDSPKSITAGSTFYGDDPEEVGICTVQRQGDRFCVFGPDGQKLGEFASMAEARTRAEEITQAMKNEADLDGNERPIGGEGQDQNAGPQIKLPDPAAGEERRGQVVIHEGEALQLGFDTGTGKYQLYRDGGSQLLCECDTPEERAEFIRAAMARAQTSATVPSRENLEGKKKSPYDTASANFDASGKLKKGNKLQLTVDGVPIATVRDGDMDADGDAEDDADGDEADAGKKRKKASEKATEGGSKADEGRAVGITPAQLRLMADELEKREGAEQLDRMKDEKEKQGGHDTPPKGYPESKKQYADPSNFKYPVDTEEHVRAAWSYINKAKNAAMYSSGELAAIKGRIKAAAKKFDIEISDESARGETDGLDRFFRCSDCAQPMMSDGLSLPGPSVAGAPQPMSFADLLKNQEGAVKASLAWNLLREALWQIAWVGDVEREAQARQAIAEFADYVAPIIGAAGVQRGEFFGPLGALERVIKEEDGKFVLYSKDGEKKLGAFDTKAEAEDREREIDYFKHEKRVEDGEEGSRESADPEEFFSRLARLEDENQILTRRLESAEALTAAAQETGEETRRLLVSAEEQVKRLSAMPAPLNRINTPVLFPEALPRNFLANRREGASQNMKELEERVAAVMALPPTLDAGEQNRRAQELMIIKAQLQEAFKEL